MILLMGQFHNNYICNFYFLNIFYSFKLLLQEIEGFSIKSSIITKNNPEFDEIYENDSLFNLISDDENEDDEN